LWTHPLGPRLPGLPRLSTAGRLAARTAARVAPSTSVPPCAAAGVAASATSAVPRLRPPFSAIPAAPSAATLLAAGHPLPLAGFHWIGDRSRSEGKRRDQDECLGSHTLS
jgi:hypothetical protein